MIALQRKLDAQQEACAEEQERKTQAMRLLAALQSGQVKHGGLVGSRKADQEHKEDVCE